VPITRGKCLLHARVTPSAVCRGAWEGEGAVGGVAEFGRGEIVWGGGEEVFDGVELYLCVPPYSCGFILGGEQRCRRKPSTVINTSLGVGTPKRRRSVNKKRYRMVGSCLLCIL